MIGGQGVEVWVHRHPPHRPPLRFSLCARASANGGTLAPRAQRGSAAGRTGGSRGVCDTRQPEAMKKKGRPGSSCRLARCSPSSLPPSLPPCRQASPPLRRRPLAAARRRRQYVSYSIIYPCCVRPLVCQPMFLLLGKFLENSAREQNNLQTRGGPPRREKYINQENKK